MHISSDLNRVQKKCQFIASWGINLMNFFPPILIICPTMQWKMTSSPASFLHEFFCFFFSSVLILPQNFSCHKFLGKVRRISDDIDVKIRCIYRYMKRCRMANKNKTQKSSPPSELIKWWFDKFSCVRLYWYVDWCQTRISAVDSDIKFYDGAYNCTNR